MVIKKVTHKVNAKPQSIPDNNYLSGRIGFWALVTEQNSLNNTVTVISDTGYEYKNIPVKSDEWVTVEDNKNFIPSTRNIPPVNSRVFVLTPTRTANGAFVLCSGFSRGDENIRTLWAKDENELEEKNNIRETKTQGGWDATENYKNGNLSFISNDEKVKIYVQLVDDPNDSSKKKKIEIDAWGNKTVIDENGFQIIATTGKKLKIGNNIDTIKGILSDMLTILNSTLTTAGSPASHTVVPHQFDNVITKLNQVLE